MRKRKTKSPIDKKTFETLIKIGAGAIVTLCGLGIGKLISDAYKKSKLSIYDEMKKIVLKYRTYSLIRKIAKELTSGVNRQDVIGRIREIYYYIQDEYDYLENPYGLSFITPPDQLIFVRGGDCKCLSVFLATLLVSVGHRTQLVFVPRHAFVRVFVPTYQVNELPVSILRWPDRKLKGAWIPLEATAKGVDIGYLTPTVKKHIVDKKCTIVDLK